VVDLVRQLAPTPTVQLAGLSARALDNGPETLGGVLRLLLVELGYNYEHGFVSVYFLPPPVCYGFPKTEGSVRKAGAVSLVDRQYTDDAGSLQTTVHTFTGTPARRI
jgi:hypothetical protein